MTEVKKSYSPKKIAIFFMLICAVLQPLFSISVRLINPGLPPLTQLYIRLAGALILTVVFFYKHIRFDAFKKLSSKDWLYLFSMGMIGLTLSVYFFIRGSVQEKLLNVAVIGSTDILIVYILSLLIFKKKFRPKMLLLIILSLVGVAFMATKSFIPTFGAFGQGDAFLLLVAFTAAIYIISRKLLSDKLNDLEVTIITLVIATVSSFILSLISGEHPNFTNLSNTRVIFGLILGAVLSVIVMPLQNYAFKHISGLLATQLFLLSNIFSLIFGYIFYKEVIGMPELVGSVLIVGCVYLTSKFSTTK